jgi:hypothetical protein
MIFFLCSGSYTLCKKKSYINQPIRRNRTNVFTTSHLVNNSNLYSNPSYRSELSSTNSFNNNEYFSTQYYTNNNNLRPTTNFVEPTTSFINQPPPSYWQIMNQSNNTVNTNSSIRPPPPSYLNVSTLNKQNTK